MSSQPGEKKIFWKLPYNKCGEPQLRNSIKRINANLNDGFKLLACFKTTKTSSFFKNKDRIPSSLASNVVYEFSCDRCNNRYIGETTRHLVTRAKEHLSGKPTPTEISMHCHPGSLSLFKVVLRTKHTRLAESITLQDRKNDKDIINERDSSIPIHLYL